MVNTPLIVVGQNKTCKVRETRNWERNGSSRLLKSLGVSIPEIVDIENGFAGLTVEKCFQRLVGGSKREPIVDQRLAVDIAGFDEPEGRSKSPYCDAYEH